MLVADKRKATGVSSPSIARYENVHNLPISIKKGKEIVGAGSEGDVKDEERVGIPDVGRARTSEMRHGNG